MDFKEFATKYLDPANRPANNSLVWTIQDSGLGEGIVQGYIDFARKVVSDSVYLGKGIPALVDILAAWDAAHPPAPPGVYRNTPFGTQEFVPLSELKASDLTVQQLHDLVVDAVKAAVGK